MAGRLEDKVAVVTGGASGIGEATVRRFVEEGARVLAGDVQDEAGKALAESLGDAVRYRRVDVTLESDVAGAVDEAVEAWGRLDCMFNNAGIVGAVGPIDEIEVEDFDATMAVLLRGPFLGTKHAARIMKPQGSGVILSTSSIAGLRGGYGPHVYAAAKSALVGFTQNIAAELGPHGVRVNCIAPGNMATPMVANLVTKDPDDVETTTKALASVSPIKGRPGVAKDIADAALWLASDEAGYVTGHVLTVDGGLASGLLQEAAKSMLRPGPMFRERGRRGR